MKEIKIITEYIRLDSLLKLTNLVGTGGEAKIMIQEGKVKVNGKKCLMRGKKLHGGDKVNFNEEEIIIREG